MEEIFGFVESVVFSGEESGFTVAKLKEPRKKDLTCIVGVLPGLRPGETLRCKGFWKHHPQYGVQFEVKEFETTAPSDLIGMQKYLESGLIKGIGPKYAERIVKTFGLETLHIIDETPDRLHEVKGLGKNRIDHIKHCWQDQRSIRSVMIFLRKHGLSPSLAHKIYKAYGDTSVAKICDNPFLLAREVKGIGFKTADTIAKNLGLPHNATSRIDAGILHVLWELANFGHTCFPLDVLVQEVRKALEIENALIQERIESLIKGKELITCEERISLPMLFYSERGIAIELKRLHQVKGSLRSIDTQKAIAWAEQKLGLAFAQEQKEAIATCFQEKIVLITGGPGTGKSTITKAILAIARYLTSDILLAAPTGKAAKRLSEITGMRAQTLHSLLEMDFQSGSFKKNHNNPLECALLIIDESSMIDVFLMHHALKALPSHAHCIFIGDVDQLPSVGPGAVLQDLIQGETLPVCRLKQIFRQGAGSRIVANAHAINQGIFPDLSLQWESDFHYVPAQEPEQIVETIIPLIKEELPKSHQFHPFDDIQVLTPMKRGIIGTENLNVQLQRVLNPSSHPLQHMGRSFHVGDKIMQISNNYEKGVFNGDVGKIVEISFDEQAVRCSFDGKVQEYNFFELDELQLAYAVSIHKYQGSECPCIIIPVHVSHFKLLFRKLLYTGLTRGKKRVIFVGTKQAIAIAIRNEEGLKRYTQLAMHLREQMTSTRVH